MKGFSPRCSVSEKKSLPVAGRRRGQTLVVALAILFLMVLLGALFVTMVVRNLQRVTRQGEGEETLTLALAGLQYAAQQFRSSESGADWRPRGVDRLWQTRTPPPPSATDPDPAATRLRDPDYVWLSDNGTFENPFIRVQTGRGRFLLRVTYLPRFRFASRNSETAGIPDEYDPNSGTIQIESIGRSGEVDVNDPTTLRRPGLADYKAIPGQFHKVEAYVPVGLVDQLWWITNVTNERGPAAMGVPPFKDGNGREVEYASLFEGSIRSNVSVQWHGRNVVRVYPARAEGMSVKGSILFSSRANDPTTANEPQLRIDVMDDDGGNAQTGTDDPNATAAAPPTVRPDNQNDNPRDDVRIAVRGMDGDPSPTYPQLDPIPVRTSGSPAPLPADRILIADDKHLRTDQDLTAHSVRTREAPALNQVDPVTGINRWLRLTRDSGATVSVTSADGSETRVVNTGWYGLTDATLPAHVRAQGLYIDNHAEIQYPTDPSRVKRDWLRSGTDDPRNTGWIADYYIPSVREGSSTHPITDLFLTRDGGGRPVIEVTQSYQDVRQMNLRPDTGRGRLFYQLTGLNPAGNAGRFTPVGTSRQFDYPANGVVFAEGSIRIRGTIGTEALAKQLTVVSGGTIYIEGNLLKGHRASFLGLLAHDYVTLNPTAFTRIRPGEEVVLEPDAFGPSGQPTSYHFTIQQGSDFDFSINPAEALNEVMLHVKHSAVHEDPNSRTWLSLYRPNGGGKYDFGANTPADPAGVTPPVPPYSGINQLFYMFRDLSAGELRDIPFQDPVNWAESRFQTPGGSPANFERKSFRIDSPLVAGQDNNFRMVVGEVPLITDAGEDPAASGQPYWLSRLALLPTDRPLPIRIEAVIYAYRGSWFVIPPPFFNDNPEDTRAKAVADTTANGTPHRPLGTFPRYTDQHPFYNEALNIEIDLKGAISENMPAAPHEKARWMNQLYVDDRGPYDPAAFPLPSTGQTPLFRPNIRYRFDHDIRRMVRARLVQSADPTVAPTGYEEIVWTAPTTAPPPGMRTLDQFISNTAVPAGSFVETMPVLPRLPAGRVIYEGNPL